VVVYASEVAEGSKIMLVLYTKANCAACKDAKNWLKHKGYEYEEAELNDPGLLAAFKLLHPDVRTLPAISDEDGNILLSWKTEAGLI
jgi:glutaredoxin